jgi:hypothetical protein
VVVCAEGRERIAIGRWLEFLLRMLLGFGLLLSTIAAVAGLDLTLPNFVCVASFSLLVLSVEAYEYGELPANRSTSPQWRPQTHNQTAGSTSLFAFGHKGAGSALGSAHPGVLGTRGGARLGRPSAMQAQGPVRGS